MLPPIVERLNQPGAYLLYDGAKGTFLASHVEQPGYPTDLLNLTHPDVVGNTLKQYVDAGAMVVQTNTFCANKLRLGQSGYGDRTYEINVKGAQIARKVVGDDVYVAGDIGPTGQILYEEGDVYTLSDFVQAFKPQVQGLVDGGVDLLHIETMSSIREIMAAVQAINEVRLGFPTIVTMTFSRTPRGEFRTGMGVKPVQLVTLADERGLLGRGVNCGIGPEGAEQLLQEVGAGDSTKILVAKLNAGIPRLVGGVAIYPATPEDMAKHALSMYDLGVKIIGACCGSTPRHIEAMADALARVS